MCNRDVWLEGLWILSIGATVVVSSITGLVCKNLFYFRREDT